VRDTHPFPSLCAARRDILRVRSWGGSGDLSYLIFLGRLGLATWFLGLWMSCCGVEASTLSTLSSALTLVVLRDAGGHWVCLACILSALPCKGPASVPGICWQASIYSPGGLVASNSSDCRDPSAVLVLRC
jgi:hypothetical protein